MAITASGIFLSTFHDTISGATALAFEGTGASIPKIWLASDSVSPVFTVAAAAYTTYSAQEVSSTNWPASGVALASNVIDIASFAGNLVFDAADVSVASTTLVNAMGAFIMSGTSAALALRLICLVDFVTAVTSTAGDFIITWTAPGSGGIMYLDLLP
jgi:hypothetical protein